MSILNQLTNWANKAGGYLPVGISVPTRVVNGGRRLLNQAGQIISEANIPANVVNSVTNFIPEVSIPKNVVDYRPSLPGIGQVGEWARSLQDNIPNPWGNVATASTNPVNTSAYKSLDFKISQLHDPNIPSAKKDILFKEIAPYLRDANNKIQDPSIPWTERDLWRQRIEAVYGIGTDKRERRLGYQLAAKRPVESYDNVVNKYRLASLAGEDGMAHALNNASLPTKAYTYAGALLEDNPWIVPTAIGTTMGAGGFYLGRQGRPYDDSYGLPPEEQMTEEEMAMMLQQEGMV